MPDRSHTVERLTLPVDPVTLERRFGNRLCDAVEAAIPLLNGQKLAKRAVHVGCIAFASTVSKPNPGKRTWPMKNLERCCIEAAAAYLWLQPNIIPTAPAAQVQMEVLEVIFSDMRCWIKVKFGNLLARSSMEIDDILQEVRMKALRKGHQYSPEKGSLYAWVYKITQRHCWKLYREQKLAIDPAGESLIHAADSASFLSWRRAQKSSSETEAVDPRFKMALDAIKNPCQRALAGLFMDMDCGYAKEAVALKIYANENTATATLSRMLRKLRLAFSAHSPNPHSQWPNGTRSAKGAKQ